MLDRRRGMEVSEADDLVVELRDHDPVTDDDEALEPRGNGRSVRLVAQLAEQRPRSPRHLAAGHPESSDPRRVD